MGERYTDTVEVGSSILPAPTKRKAVRDGKSKSPAKRGAASFGGSDGNEMRTVLVLEGW